MKTRTTIKTVILIICIKIGAIHSFAQGNDFSASGISVNVRLFPNSGLAHPNAEGSPFLEEDFKDVKINDDSRTYEARYNVYLDHMELQINGQSRILKSDNNSIKIVYEEGKVFETVNLEDNENRYAELMWESDGNKLYKVFKIIFTPASPGNGYQSSTPAKYSEVKESLYFLKEGNNNPEELSNSKNRRFKSLFDSKIKKKAKENNLDIKKDGDLIQLLEKYYKK